MVEASRKKKAAQREIVNKKAKILIKMHKLNFYVIFSNFIIFCFLFSISLGIKKLYRSAK